MRTIFLIPFLLLPLSGLLAQNRAANEASVESTAIIPDGSYVLTELDGINVLVFDEPDLSVDQRIDNDGNVRMPLIGTVEIAGMTIRTAEDHLETLYREKRILRDPMITIRINFYSPKEINILGAVRSPGKHQFPPEENEMDIVDVIAMVGGFTPLAKSHNVLIKRETAEGKERSFTIDVERMISAERDGQQVDTFMVKPGDSIWVGEKIW